jgi:hypothetical protein
MSDRHHALIERLAQGLEDMAAEFGELIQEEHAVVRQRHCHRLSAGADQRPFTGAPHQRMVRAQAEPVADRRRVGYHMTKPPSMLIDCPVM